MNSFIPEYVDALLQEISWMSTSSPQYQDVHTIFFGGGTPSILDVDIISSILDRVRETFHVVNGAEITLEANPGTLNPAFLRGLFHHGVNRLSIGMQSFHPDDLRLLGRIHQYGDVVRAVGWARAAGFSNISLDLIYGIPGQSLERWSETLHYALALNPTHLSLYSLTIEEGTPLYEWWRKGLVTSVDEDGMADRFSVAEQILVKSGFKQYEISNWSLANASGVDYRCIHNLQYWRNLPYIGFGAGAHSFFLRHRFQNAAGIREYIARMHLLSPQSLPASPAAVETTPIDRWTEMEETMMLGLRLVDDGVNPGNFYDRFQVSMNDVFARQIRKLIKQGLLEQDEPPENRIRLTHHGRLLGNRAFLEFIGNTPPVGLALDGK